MTDRRAVCGYILPIPGVGENGERVAHNRFRLHIPPVPNALFPRDAIDFSVIGGSFEFRRLVAVEPPLFDAGACHLGQVERLAVQVNHLGDRVARGDVCHGASDIREKKVDRHRVSAFAIAPMVAAEQLIVGLPRLGHVQLFITPLPGQLVNRPCPPAYIVVSSGRRPGNVELELRHLLFSCARASSAAAAAQPRHIAAQRVQVCSRHGTRPQAHPSLRQCVPAQSAQKYRRS